MTKRQYPQARPADVTRETAASSRTDEIIAIVDHCTAAQALADGIDHRFLSYLLAMTIQEARTSLRPDDIRAVSMLAEVSRSG